MNVNKYIESLNFEKEKDSRYYVDYLKGKGVKIEDNTIEVKAARYHLAKYGIINSEALLQLSIKYDLDKKKTLKEVQEEVARIYYGELQKATN